MQLIAQFILGTLLQAQSQTNPYQPQIDQRDLNPTLQIGACNQDIWYLNLMLRKAKEDVMERDRRINELESQLKKVNEKNE